MIAEGDGLERYDVVVIGGGAVGSAAAYVLAAEPAFDGTVLVVERDFTNSRSSTTLSCATIRQQFSTPENIEMSLLGARFLEEMGERLEVAGDRPSGAGVRGDQAAARPGPASTSTARWTGTGSSALVPT